MPNVSPDDQNHKTLEQDAIEEFANYDLLTAEATYHEVMPKEIVEILQNLWTPTALYLRGRADRIAIRKNPPLAIQWEAKTHLSQKYHDMTLEVLPLCVHMALAALDIRCLYIYRDPYRGYDVGFWIPDIPQPRVIMIPRRWATEDLNDLWFDTCVGRIDPFFPDVRIVPTGRNGGSNDPFLIVDESVVEKLPDWRALIRGAVL